MACACKVTRQLDFLHKKYGDKLPQSKKTDIVGDVKAKLSFICTSILAVPLFPVFAIRAIATGKHGIYNIDKIFKLKNRNVGKQ